MKNKASIVAIVVIIIIVVAIVAGGIWYFVVNKPEKCAKEGEKIGTCVGCIQKCCEGLKEMNSGAYNDECVKVPPPPGLGATCSNCGNGICDTQNNENKCTCPEDCKDETADWKTYRNKEYGFEMKYPKEWTYKEEENYIYFLSPKRVETQFEGEDFNVEIEQTNYTDIQNWFNDKFRDREPMMVPENSFISVGGIYCLRITDPITYAGESYVYCIKDSKIYKIAYSQGILGILSTFKFIE